MGSKIHTELRDADQRQLTIKNLSIGDFFCFSLYQKTIWVLWNVTYAKEDSPCFTYRNIETGSAKYTNNGDAEVLVLDAKITCQLA